MNSGASSSYNLNQTNHQTVAPLKLSFSQLTTRKLSLMEEVLQLKQSGYDAIGLWRPKIDEVGEYLAADLLQEHGLFASSLSFAGGFTGSCGFTYLEALADARRAIAQARILGAEQVIMVTGSRNNHTIRHSRRNVVDALRELGDAAGIAQVRLSLLPMHASYSSRWSFVNTLDDAVDLLNEANHPSLSLAFDTYHLSQEQQLADRVASIAHLTGLVQLSDSDRQSQTDNDRLLPGDGELALKEVVQAFQLAGYSGYFEVQGWTGQLWRAHHSHLIEQTHARVKGMSLKAAVTT